MSDSGFTPPPLGTAIATLVEARLRGSVASYRYPPTPRDIRQREAAMIYDCLRILSRKPPEPA